MRTGQHCWSGELTLAAKDPIDRLIRLVEHALGDESAAVAAGEDQTVRTASLDRLRQADDVGHVCEAIDAEAHRVGAGSARRRSIAPGEEACRSTIATGCPAVRTAVATRSMPSGSRRKESPEYINVWGWTSTVRTVFAVASPASLPVDATVHPQPRVTVHVLRQHELTPEPIG